MARHRNIRGLKYDEDFEDDDVYGQSVEDDYCISPATAAQFIYKRDDYNSRAFAEEPLEEDDEFEDKVEESSHSNMPLSGVDQVRLYACLDKMREVLGESASEQVMVDAVLNCEYDAHKALDLVLSEECKPTPDKKNQITASSRKSTIGDPFHSSKLVVSKHTDSCFPVPLLYDADSSSTFDLSILLSTKSEQSCVSSAPVVAHESINNESANEGDQTLTQSVSLSEMIKETPNLLQTHTRVPNGPFADETTINSQRGINLADLIKDCEGNSQDLNPLILSVLPNVMDCTRLSTDKTKLSLSTQNKSEGILQPAPTELLFKVGDTNHIQPTYLTLSSQNPECLVPSLKGLNLIEQLNQHQKKNDGRNDSWDTAGQSSLKDIVEMHGSLSFPQCGSPSLADLIEEHKKGKAREQPTRVDADIIPKVAKMTVSGKQVTGFNIPRANVDENDHLQKGAVPNEVFPSALLETSLKPNAVGSVSPLNEETTVVQTPSKVSTKTRQQLDVKVELEKRQGGKQLLNLVVIGHVDAGKSTLMGHVLFLLGNVNKRVMHKYEQESKKAGKASFAFAWVLDETGEERERGVTMDVGVTKFETKTKVITLMDAPGHKDFIPNMITGAAQADVAILVVDASRGEFEAGFEAGGQTREHALLVRSLGVTQLAVAVNKMDQVKWQPERFKEISIKLGHFLKQAGFKDSDVAYVPTAGLTGENLTARSQVAELRAWYNGPCLLEQIDSFKSPQRPVEKPFRLCVSDVFKDQGSGFNVAGKIEAGYVQTGDRVLVVPPNETCTVKGITLHEEPLDWAAAGDHVILTVTGVDIIKINVGCIFCDPKAPIKTCTRFRARVLIFNIDIPVTQGLPVLLHYQTLSEPCTIRRLVSVLHKSSGEVLKKKPKCLTKGQNALIELQAQRPVSLELYKDFKELGRFMLRYGGSTIAAGVVTEIKE
ncbi:HBS1-like protein isoform X1 [Hemitrygon akajei]|uniref:HBS1-like protein isoform X1 n=1 Tax=Hemitrygon akajei TaxID=2704970 RepID=UPI003BF9B95A